MQKIDRLLAIEEIIGHERIASQEVLLKKLEERGIECTQATLSRDLRQLGVGRIPDGQGGYCYSLSGHQTRRQDFDVRMNIIPLVRDMIEARGLMLVKTIPGNANTVAYFIDSMQRYEIAGTIAGDDTILVVPRDGVTMHQIHDCLERILPGLHKHLE